MLVLGIDPDLTSTACAVYDSRENEVLRLVLQRAGSYEEMLSFVSCPWVDELSATVSFSVVEGQQIYVASNRRNVDPNDILCLAQVAGAVYSRLTTQGAIPKPAEWKGQRSKLAEHTKYAKLLGWETERAGGKDPYLVPTQDYVEVETSDGKPVKRSDWKHLMDAIGLAIWGSTPKGQAFISKFTSA
jgi:hypothetical protein